MSKDKKQQPEPGSPEAIRQSKVVLNTTGDLERWAELFFPRNLQQDPLMAEIAKLRRELKRAVKAKKQAKLDGVEKKLLKVSEVAVCLNIGKGAVRKLVMDGVLPAVKRGDIGSTAAWLIPKDAVDKYIERETGSFSAASDR